MNAYLLGVIILSVIYTALAVANMKVYHACEDNSRYVSLATGIALLVVGLLLGRPVFIITLTGTLVAYLIFTGEARRDALRMLRKAGIEVNIEYLPDVGTYVLTDPEEDPLLGEPYRTIGIGKTIMDAAFDFRSERIWARRFSIPPFTPSCS